MGDHPRNIPAMFEFDPITTAGGVGFKKFTYTHIHTHTYIRTHTDDSAQKVFELDQSPTHRGPVTD